MDNYPTTSDAVNDRSNQLESVEVADDFLRELEMDYNWEQVPEAPEIVDDWEQAPEALVEMTDDSEQGANQRPGTPDELIEIADNASKELLPAKSNQIKMRVNIVVPLFDVESYAQVSAFLKVKAKGHEKKATILTEADITRFIDEAPDALWLDVKVVSIFASFGACRSHEFATIRMNDIKRYDDMYYVIIDRKVTKTDKSNEFAIIGRFLDTNHFGTTFNNSGSSRELRNASVQNRNLRRMEFNSTDEDDSKRDIDTADFEEIPSTQMSINSFDSVASDNQINTNMN
ncbi:hypothetical protein Bhyg_16490 [Pseudolycoriella hygida]|uniref:Uncharacterized protein n=1 Tax=Pseudolycoriella hygida TaxID=35572 RepID=A0A9Q0MHC4_9DIPT|nr:hypothetical protein Bhyg_16490 [Pseudolycoriella hygida]